MFPPFVEASIFSIAVIAMVTLTINTSAYITSVINSITQRRHNALRLKHDYIINIQNNVIPSLNLLPQHNAPPVQAGIPAETIEDVRRAIHSHATRYEQLSDPLPYTNLL